MFRLLNSLDTETLLKNKALLSVFITDNPRLMRIRGETILFVELDVGFFFAIFFTWIYRKRKYRDKEALQDKKI